MHAREDLAEEQNFGVGGEIDDAIDVGGAPDVGDASEDGMFSVSGIDDAAGGFLVMIAVVVDPGFAEDLLTEAAGPFLVAPVVVCVRALTVAFVGEGVSGSADTEDGFAGVDEVDDVDHLIVGEFAKAEEHNHHVGVIQEMETGDIGLADWIDEAGVRIDGEEDGAFEAVAIGEDLGEHRKGFLGAVFFVACDEDEVFALTRAGFAGVDEVL